ncbi:hypothetical protein TIFTF001_051064 [Ficus carica]|uniref:Uncharacterized protein n=1 Tax=Ficus carica TaxID=3494 RepID=A0AA88CHV2_FICCA|nr:hypothetical protein TIFTF001_051064 [Ficus carica]
MGFKEENGGRSRGKDWRREREREVRERMNGGVAVGGDWKREIEGEWRERMKGGVMEEEMGFQGEIGARMKET